MDKVGLSTMSAVKKTNQFLLKQYHDLNNPASYGGVSRFAKSQGISLKRAKSILEKDVGYDAATNFLCFLLKCLRWMSSGQSISLK